MTRVHRRPLRCLAVWLTVTTGVLVVGVTVRPGLAAARRSWELGTLDRQPLDVLVVWLCAGVLGLCAGWLWLVTTAVTLGAARGLAVRDVPVCPAALRRALLAACGVAIAGALVVPAGATPGDGDQRPGSAHVLEGLRLPDRTTLRGPTVAAVRPSRGQVAPRQRAVSPRAPARRPGGPPAGDGRPAPVRPVDRPGDRPGAVRADPVRADPVRAGAVPAGAVRAGGLRDGAARRVVVRPGDTLWAIAAATLPPGADDAAVVTRWRAIYALNRAVVGGDPDLILPGQRLRLPDT